jgi:hypothetical protein
MTDIVDGNIVVLTPDKRNVGESLSSPEDVEGRCLTLTFRHDPVLSTNAIAGVRVRPARNVTGREYPWRARFEIGVHDDSPVHLEAGRLCELDAGKDADPRDDEIGLKGASALQPYLSTLNSACRLLQMKDNAMLFMERPHQSTQIGAKNSLHRSFFRRHHMDFDFSRAQGGGDFEPDKARAQYDGPTRSLRSFDDGVAFGERAQHEDVRLVRARNGGPHWLGAGGQKEPIERDRLSIGEPDLMRASVNLRDGRVETKVDVVVRIETRVAQRHPFLGRAAGEVGRSTGGASSALSMTISPWYSCRRSISTAANPAAPPPTTTILLGAEAADLARGFDSG